MNRFSASAVVSLVVFFSCLRFFDVANSPGGFYLDEAAIAAQVICLKDSGHDLHNGHLPLFSSVLGGGYVTPPFLYLGAAWTSVFGESVASFRSFTALFGVLFVVATYFFAFRLWGTREAAWLAALCAALSPWAFQFSRISWDPGLAPAFMTGALALAMATGPRARLEAMFSGFLFALAAYSYPPLRVEIALVLPVLFLVEFTRDRALALKKAIPLAVTVVVTSVPLVVLTLRGDIQGRFKMLSVFNERYLRHFGEPTFLLGLKHFFLNLTAHFSPSYLFLQGDGNPRHSTFTWGEWSALEILALILALGFLVRISWKKQSIGNSRFAIVFVVFGYVAGVIPAAMTWESNPHALRSIGALAFLATAAGGALSLLWSRSRAYQGVVVAIAIAFGSYYYISYFTRYARWGGLYFDQPAVEEIRKMIAEKTLTMENVRANPETKDYPRLALRYFQQEAGLFKCQ